MKWQVNCPCKLKATKWHQMVLCSVPHNTQIAKFIGDVPIIRLAMILVTDMVTISVIGTACPES